MPNPQSQYLDPRWQRLRLRIFERDDFTCRCCGTKTETLHAHHHRYRRRCHNNTEWAIETIRENAENGNLHYAVCLVQDCAELLGDSGDAAISLLECALEQAKSRTAAANTVNALNGGTDVR